MSDPKVGGIFLKDLGKISSFQQQIDKIDEDCIQSKKVNTKEWRVTTLVLGLLTLITAAGGGFLISGAAGILVGGLYAGLPFLLGSVCLIIMIIHQTKKYYEANCQSDKIRLSKLNEVILNEEILEAMLEADPMKSRHFTSIIRQISTKENFQDFVDKAYKKIQTHESVANSLSIGLSDQNQQNVIRAIADGVLKHSLFLSENLPAEENNQGPNENRNIQRQMINFNLSSGLIPFEQQHYFLERASQDAVGEILTKMDKECYAEHIERLDISSRLLMSFIANDKFLEYKETQLNAHQGDKVTKLIEKVIEEFKDTKYEDLVAYFKKFDLLDFKHFQYVAETIISYFSRKEKSLPLINLKAEEAQISDATTVAQLSGPVASSFNQNTPQQILEILSKSLQLRRQHAVEDEQGIGRKNLNKVKKFVDEADNNSFIETECFLYLLGHISKKYAEELIENVSDWAHIPIFIGALMYKDEKVLDLLAINANRLSTSQLEKLFEYNIQEDTKIKYFKSLSLNKAIDLMIDLQISTRESGIWVYQPEALARACVQVNSYDANNFSLMFGQMNFNQKKKFFDALIEIRHKLNSDLLKLEETMMNSTLQRTLLLDEEKIDFTKDEKEEISHQNFDKTAFLKKKKEGFLKKIEIVLFNFKFEFIQSLYLRDNINQEEAALIKEIVKDDYKMLSQILLRNIDKDTRISLFFQKALVKTCWTSFEGGYRECFIETLFQSLFPPNDDNSISMMKKEALDLILLSSDNDMMHWFTNQILESLAQNFLNKHRKDPYKDFVTFFAFKNAGLEDQATLKFASCMANEIAKASNNFVSTNTLLEKFGECFDKK
ncbi:MAG: hypothetical protein R3E91_01105 [Chlamydiales bacterium]